MKPLSWRHDPLIQYVCCCLNAPEWPLGSRLRITEQHKQTFLFEHAARFQSTTFLPLLWSSHLKWLGVTGRTFFKYIFSFWMFFPSGSLFKRQSSSSNRLSWLSFIYQVILTPILWNGKLLIHSLCVWQCHSTIIYLSTEWEKSAGSAGPDTFLHLWRVTSEDD